MIGSGGFFMLGSRAILTFQAKNMEVTKVVDERISDKINTQYIAAQFEGVKAGVVFWCTEFDDEPDESEWIGTGGRPGFAILVPYSVALSHPDLDWHLVELVRQRVFGAV